MSGEAESHVQAYRAPRAGSAFRVFSALLAWWALGTLLATAGRVETKDRQTVEGEVTCGDSGKMIVVANGSRQEVPFEHVRVARLNSPPDEVNPLPTGWRCEEIGGVQGACSGKEAEFRLRLSGGPARDPKKDPKEQALLFLYRVVRGDGEVAARVERAEVTNTSLAGVILRENLEPTGGFAMLGVAAGGKLRLEWREAGWHSFHSQEIGAVTLPVWLKLARQEKESAVTAYRSVDGQKWEKAGQCRLRCGVERFPEDSDSWKPRMLTGVGITGPGSNAVAKARFQQVGITVQGLLGEYFADQQFKSFRFARPDRKIEFWWGEGAPAPELEAKAFAVRWTGIIEPKYSEEYWFHYEADDGARLWVNGQQLPRLGFESRKDKVGLALQAGQRCSVKFEYKAGEESSSVRLGWSSRSQKLEVISGTQLSYTYGPGAPEEESANTNAFSARGVWLRQGSYIASDILAADDTATQVALGGQKGFVILNSKIARVILRPLRRHVPFAEAAGRAGLFLKGGDFLESAFEGVKGKSLTVTSVLFGRRSFGLDNPDALALVLNPFSPQSAAWEVALLDGSVLRARGVKGSGDALLVDDLTLGAVRIAQRQVLEIRSTGGGVGSARAAR